jgi:hypothetical protein
MVKHIFHKKNGKTYVKMSLEVYLHIPYVSSAPQRFKHQIRKSQDSKIFDQILPQKVINSMGYKDMYQ